MTRKPYRRWWRRDWRWGRLSGEIDLSGLNHPWIHVGADGDDWAWIAVGFGSTGSDPIWFIEVSLSGTRLGRLMCSVAYRWRSWRSRRATDSVADGVS